MEPLVVVVEVEALARQNIGSDFGGVATLCQRSKVAASIRIYRLWHISSVNAV